MATSSILGTWHNRYGSILTITKVAADGTLSGTFCPASGPGRGRSFVIVGVADKDCFAFTVRFSSERMTSWVGHARPKEELLDATWVSATGAVMRGDPAWKRTVSGSDFFWPGHGARLDRTDICP